MANCCCWSLPHGENPPTQYNAISFDSSGNLRWAVRWEAVDGTGVGGMDVLIDDEGQQCIKVVGTKLVALGYKDGTLHAAALNLSDGSEYLALTDTSQAIDNPATTGRILGNCVSDGTEIIYGDLRESGGSYYVQRFAVDVDGNLNFQESNAMTGFSVNRQDVRVDDSGDVVGSIMAGDDPGASQFPSPSEGIRAASVDGTGHTGAEFNSTGYFESPTISRTGGAAYVFRYEPASFPQGAWYKAAIPLGGGYSALTPIGFRAASRILFGGGFPNTPFMERATSADDHFWAVLQSSSGLSDPLAYADMTALSSSPEYQKFPQNIDGTIRTIDIAFDANNVAYHAARAGGIASYETDGTTRLLDSPLNVVVAFGSSPAPYYPFPSFTADFRLRHPLMSSPAASAIYVTWRPPGDLFRNARIVISGLALTRSWEWSGGMPLCDTTDGSGNFYGVGYFQHVRDKMELSRIL